MRITTRQSGDVAILDMSGKITIDEGALELRDAVAKTLESGTKNVLLNLADVTYVDSSGLGELVSSYSTTQNRGGSLKLLALTLKLRELLTITRLITVFEVYDDEQEAVASFA